MPGVLSFTKKAPPEVRDIWLALIDALLKIDPCKLFTRTVPPLFSIDPSRINSGALISEFVGL